MWLPKEIVIHNSVKDDPVTRNILSIAHNVALTYTRSGRSDVITTLAQSFNGATEMLDSIHAGKKVVYVSPVGNNDVDEFQMPDKRMNCPAFARIKHASNGCFYNCDWCYLKLTYRAAKPFITIRADHNGLKNKVSNYLQTATKPVMFNSGELADSLSLEHLSMFGRNFIPWFGQQSNGYLFMLTKSDNVDLILNLNHNGHTKLAWSLNEPSVSRAYEIGAPNFCDRVHAAYLAQKAGYPIRVRIDPIIPIADWQTKYADAIGYIFEVLDPERITIGTLRFEEGFYKMRDSLLQTGQKLTQFVDHFEPMLAAEQVMKNGKSKTSKGKYSFCETDRINLFSFIISEIRKHSLAPIALCKEAIPVWHAVGLNPNANQCVCQL